VVTIQMHVVRSSSGIYSRMAKIDIKHFVGEYLVFKSVLPCFFCFFLIDRASQSIFVAFREQDEMVTNNSMTLFCYI
jgi:hypothetical protein